MSHPWHAYDRVSVVTSCGCSIQNLEPSATQPPLFPHEDRQHVHKIPETALRTETAPTRRRGSGGTAFSLALRSATTSSVSLERSEGQISSSISSTNHCDKTRGACNKSKSERAWIHFNWMGILCRTCWYRQVTLGSATPWAFSLITLAISLEVEPT